MNVKLVNKKLLYHHCLRLLALYPYVYTVYSMHVVRDRYIITYGNWRTIPTNTAAVVCLALVSVRPCAIKG